MPGHRREILDMLAKGQITADEAERLLAALEAEPSPSAGERASKPRPRFLRIQVEGNNPRRDGAPIRVNVRAPMKLLHAGVRLASLIPAHARVHVNEAFERKGMHVDISQIRPENIEAILDELGDTTIDVNERDVKVRLFCE